MSKRIGKYKISKKESAVSLIDGGTATGNVLLGGTVDGFIRNGAATAAGKYIYQEEVSLIGTSNATDNAIIAYLSKALPANAKVVECAVTSTELTNVSTTAINVHISATGDTARGTAVSSGTELVGGADGTGALAAGSGGALGDTEVNQPDSAVDVGSKVSVAICNDGTGNGTAALTQGKILVSIVYYGSAAAA